MTIWAVSLLPYASLSSFLYDRHFFQGENAAGIYPCSAYYAANVTLELIFNTVNGIIFGAIVYYMVNFEAFVKPADPVACSAGFIGIIAIMNLMANVSGKSGQVDK